MKFTELLITAYDADKPAFAINIDLDHVATLLMAPDDAGLVEAAELRVTKSEAKPGAQLFGAVRELLQDLGMFEEPRGFCLTPAVAGCVPAELEPGLGAGEVHQVAQPPLQGAQG